MSQHCHLFRTIRKTKKSHGKTLPEGYRLVQGILNGDDFIFLAQQTKVNISATNTIPIQHYQVLSTDSIDITKILDRLKIQVPSSN